MTSRPCAYPLSFEHHASPEAINAHMERVRARQAALIQELTWLGALYLRRVAEKERGDWPRAQLAFDISGAEHLGSAPMSTRSQVYT